MFGKLLKYEWKAMMKTMLPIYGVTMVLAAVNGFLFQSILGGWMDRSALFSTMQTTAITLYMLILMLMGVFTAVMIVQRFYKGLLRQEGYLMFTLPVKTWKLIFSKACVSFAVSVLSMIVGILSIGLFGGLDFFRALYELPILMWAFMQEGYEANPEAFAYMVLFALEVLAGLAVAAFASIYELYFFHGSGTAVQESQGNLVSVLVYGSEHSDEFCGNASRGKRDGSDGFCRDGRGYDYETSYGGAWNAGRSGCQPGASDVWNRVCAGPKTESGIDRRAARLLTAGKEETSLPIFI